MEEVGHGRPVVLARHTELPFLLLSEQAFTRTSLEQDCPGLPNCPDCSLAWSCLVLPGSLDTKTKPMGRPEPTSNKRCSCQNKGPHHARLAPISGHRMSLALPMGAAGALSAHQWQQCGGPTNQPSSPDGLACSPCISVHMPMF